MIIGHQEWRDLLFVHFRVPAATLRPLIPRSLGVDEKDGTAWVSMTPFTMRRAQLRGLPPLPDFHELNVRTYVTHARKGPGIWFFSLEASNTLAVAAARLSVRLPYMRARMGRASLSYVSERVAGQGKFEARWTVSGEPHLAAAGSMEEFLVERYRLYSRAFGRVLWTAKVQHEPWLIQPAEISELHQTLSAAAGFDAGRPALAHWTPGVAVDFQPFVLAA
ncbi:MAG TPA: DUF2071 domain-containing protein [Myxococcales bacterium]